MKRIASLSSLIFVVLLAANSSGVRGESSGVGIAIPAVKSVEFINWGSIYTNNAGPINYPVSLTKNQNTANSVIFPNLATSDTGRYYDQYYGKWYFDPANHPGQVVFGREGVDNTITFPVATVVEFDPNQVVVYQGAFSLPSGTTSTTINIGNTIDTASAFLQFSMMSVGMSDPSDGDVLGQIINSNQIQFTRNSGRGQLDGYWFIAVAQNGNFSIQHALITIPSGSSSANATITPVDPSKTMLIASESCTDTNNYVEASHSLLVTLAAGNPSSQVTITRPESTAYSVTSDVEVITFNDNTTVVSGTVDTVVQDTYVDASMIDPTRTIPWSPVGHRINYNDSKLIGGTGHEGLMKASYCRLSFTADGQMQIERDGGDVPTTKISYEMVQLDVMPQPIATTTTSITTATTTTSIRTKTSTTTTTMNNLTITNVAPKIGLPSTHVTIIGRGFTGTTDVQFSGAPAPFTVLSNFVIRATVPVGATTGLVSVTTPAGTATSSFNFAIPPPVVTTFAPKHGAAGSTVTIVGKYFSGTTDVQFNGTPATFTVMSNNVIKATVPAGATTGPISVTTPYGTATSAKSFAIP